MSNLTVFYGNHRLTVPREREKEISIVEKLFKGILAVKLLTTIRKKNEVLTV